MAATPTISRSSRPLRATIRPRSIPSGSDFFGSLDDDAGRRQRKNAKGAVLAAAATGRCQANGELVSALDGNWGRRREGTSRRRSRPRPQPTAPCSTDADVLQATRDSVRAIMMIRAYRMRGHLHANLDPLGIAKPLEDYNELSPETYGFTEADYDRQIFIDNVLGPRIRDHPRRCSRSCERTYCSTLGVEFMHISDPGEKAWIQERIEGPDKDIAFTAEGKKAILQKLIEAEGFEQFIDVKYNGTKRFGLDGGESLIPALEQIIKRGGALGMKEIVLGMAHRGRLNVLSPGHGASRTARSSTSSRAAPTAPDDVEGSGDVKYHLGASSDREFDGNKVHLSLTANPSHLEIVDPVVLGKARAKQDQLFGAQPRRDRAAGRARQGAAAAAAWRRGLCRPGRDRRDASACRACAATASPARCTSSSTTRSASPPIRASRARRPIRPTWPR